MAALRLYSSSTALLLLCFMKKIIPPTMAAMARTPTTTPTAMPTLLVPPPELLLAELDWVTTIVWPAFVITDGDEPDDDDPPLDVEVGFAELLAPSVSTLLLRPDKYTVKELSPPQFSRL